jgi:3-phenylpropionate/trans-cinnamate dioxygenase ferredoxin subunit
LAVFRVGDAVYAIDDSCPHAGASLSGGRTRGTTVACLAHGLKFPLAHGRPRDPAKLQARTHALRVVDGHVMLEPEPSLPATDPESEAGQTCPSPVTG